MKKNEVKLEWVRGPNKPGVASVIGKHPKYLPYVNIDDAEGNLIVSLTPLEMNRLTKKWLKAWGER